jgi:hypothetical protein
MKKPISFILILCMVLAMMPMMTITASAAEPTLYDVWVGGVRVTSDNCSNITGEGITGTVTYDPVTKILTLDGATITKTFPVSYSSTDYAAGIYGSGFSAIKVVNDSKIELDSSTSHTVCGILAWNFTISSGNGKKLDIIVDNSTEGTRGIYGIGNTTISGIDLTANAGSSTEDGSWGLYIEGATLTISGGAVTATAGNAKFSSVGITALHALQITGGAVVTATGSNSFGNYSSSFSAGIRIPNSSSYISGSTVTATGGTGQNGYGIYTNTHTLSIIGGSVTAKISAVPDANHVAVSSAAGIDISGYSGAKILAGDSGSSAKVVDSYGGQKYVKYGTMTTYAVTYNNNGGAGTMAAETAADGVGFSLPACSFTPPASMVFGKWAVGSTGGTQVAENGSYTFTGDTTVYALWKPPAPSAPDMSSGTDSGANSTDNITKDNTPTFTGTAQPNSDITLISSVSGTIGTGTADGSGNWSITASSALGDGGHTITATASDSGISSDPSSGLSITIDTAGPSGYGVNIDQAAINNTNKSAMSFAFSGAEVGATYNYTVSSSGGGSVNGNGTVASTTQQITGINVGGLGDGTLTLSVTLTDTAGNTGAAVTDTVSKDATAPLGYSVSIDQAAIVNTNKAAASFTFAGAEIGATYNYALTSSGGPGNVTGSGTITGATQQVSGINVGGLADGTLTLSVTLTDTAGNTGSAATDTVSKDAAAPSGYSVNIDQASIDNTNKTAMSFTFSGAEVGAAYSYTVSSSGGAGSVTGSGIVGGVAYQITGIDITSLADGTLTLSVTLTDGAGNAGTAATDTVGKDTTAPIASSFSPANNANTAAINADMIITFNEAVTAVAGKNIIIKKASDNSTVESIDAADIKVTGSGSTTITINPAAALLNSTGYYIQIDAGAFKDAHNNYYGGIANSTTWGFTTASAGNGSGGGGGGGSAAPLVTKIESGESVVSTNLDKLVKDGKALTVEGKTGEKLVLDTAALKTIDGQTKDNIKVEIKDVSSDYKNEHPDRLVVSLSITAGGKHITSFGNGTATVSLPYELKAGEKAADVTVWYLAEDGTMTEVPCTYDATTKLATFKVNHFSLYVVGTADTSKWTNPYSDVKESSWFYDAVRYVSANEMMRGTSDTTFKPGAKTTRGMIVTILWRMENESKAAKDVAFTDVKSGKYYHDAVAWASEKDIVGGYSADKFGPEDNITREQLAVILHNYAVIKGYKTDAAADLSAFGDAGKAHSWSKDSLSWASGKGLIKGSENNLLDPLGSAERCQVAAILQRFVENTVK